MEKKIILASKSPRRAEILKMAGIDFSIVPSNVDENIKIISPTSYAMELSRLKANDIFKAYPDEIVIGADTIVVIDDIILGKPKNEEDAFDMLKKLSGKTHTVITGVTIVGKDIFENFECTSFVKMYENDDNTIKNYIKTKEPMDKAGSYGIQGKGAILIEKIEGCYYNIMGFPIEAVRKIKHYLYN